MTSFRQYAVAAAFAFATTVVPAFAWGADAPDSAYSVNHRPAHASRAQAYDNSVARPRFYDIAPLYTYQAPTQDPGAYAASQPTGFKDLH